MTTNTFFLSVLFSVGTPSADAAAMSAHAVLARANVATVVHVFTVEVEQSIDWVKQHADELAARITRRNDYVGLYVTTGHHPFPPPLTSPLARLSPSPLT
jgi:hypothetical protein